LKQAVLLVALTAACSTSTPVPVALPHRTAPPTPVRAATAPSAKPLRWTTGPALPVAVSEVGVSVLGSSIHVLGGYVAGRPHSTTHLVFDATTRRWHRAAPLPQALDHVGTVSLGGLVWAVGGYGDTPGGSTGVWSWDPTKDSWTAHAPLPNPRAAGVCIVLGGRLHYVGGKSNGRDVAEHDVYDPATNRWTTAAPMITPPVPSWEAGST
jgi:hypothetical protein